LQVGGSNRAVGAAGAKECSNVLNLVALAAAAASTSVSPALVSTAPWWEKVTVTVSGDGDPRSCHYENSLSGEGARQCDVETASGALGDKGSGTKDEFTSITFERRFSPSATADKGGVQPGDTLLGGQVMALSIDAAGAVSGCKVVAAAGDMTPDYGCEEAKAERFQASAGDAAVPARQAYLTILVYAHSENVA
jgi:hypothetical protein